METSKITSDKAEVKLEKRLDISNSVRLKHLLLELISQGIKKVSLDFTNTENIDSSGLGKILYFSDLLKQKGGFLKLVNVQNQDLVDLFKLIKLGRIINIEFK